MASIMKEISIAAGPDQVWEAVRDFGAVHRRLVPGFVTACRLDGDGARVVTFFNGAVAREVLVGVDEAVRRLAYTVVEGPLGSTHHHSSVQVFGDDGGCRFVWITDVLPDELGARIDEMMSVGLDVIKRTMEKAGVPSAR